MRTLAILAVVGLMLFGVAVVMILILFKPGPDEANVFVASRPPGDPIAGRSVTQKFGCIQCHSDDGSIIRGPSYKGLYGSRVNYTDGTSGYIDEAEVRDALLRPAAKVIAGYEPLMPAQRNLTEAEIQNLIAYLWTLRAGAK